MEDEREVNITVDPCSVVAWTKDGRVFVHRCDGKRCKALAELKRFIQSGSGHDDD